MIDNCNIKNLAKLRSLLFFIRALFAEVCYRALYGDGTFVPFGGTQTWRQETNRNICHTAFCYKSVNLSL